MSETGNVSPQIEVLDLSEAKVVLIRLPEGVEPHHFFARKRIEQMICAEAGRKVPILLVPYGYDVEARTEAVLLAAAEPG